MGGSARQPDQQAASASEVGRFETDIVSQRRDLTALMNLSAQWIDKIHHQQQLLKQLILDMDSSVSETYGEQKETADNGHLRARSISGAVPG